MFRRSKPDPVAESPAPEAPAPRGTTPGKGRPTPTRKEAEAAARARAKVPRTRKEQVAAQKLAKAESSAQIRAGMKTGEERYLLARDKGPVRRFCRDYVDARFSVLELAIPILFVFLVPGFFGSALAVISEIALLLTLLVMIVAAALLRRRVLGEVRRRFPDTTTKGLTYYLLSRGTQMRFMRIPKPQVERGATLPDRYR